MARIALIADTTACLTSEMIEQYGIRLVAANVHYGDRIYKEYVDISISEAYRLFAQDPEAFATSAAAPGDYVEAFRELAPHAEGILCITISSRLSAFYEVAHAAREQVRAELPDTTIEIVDSRHTAAAEGFVVLAAARAIAEGRDMAQAIAQAQAVSRRLAFYICFDTIRHAYRSGRIPKIASQVGSALSVRPIVSIGDGVITFIGVTRTKERGLRRILHIAEEQVGERPVHMAVIHADAPDEAERLKERVQGQFNCCELWTSEFSPVMGYSTGPGLAGLAYYTED
ncbi:MAG: DegV family protein [Chloroflexota bacterium]|nr:DegV family protein [Chloroflexota bacterium]